MTAAHNTLELIEARREIVRLKEQLAKAQTAHGTAGPSDHAGLVDSLTDEQLRFIADSKDVGSCRARIRAAIAALKGGGE